MNTLWLDPMVFAPACLLGGGLVLALAVGLGTPRRRGLALARLGLLGLMALIASGFACSAYAHDQPVVLWGSAAAIPVFAALFLLLPSPMLTAGHARFAALAGGRRSRLGAALVLFGLCPFLTLGLLDGYLAPPPSVGMEELANLLQGESFQSSLETLPHSPLSTDRGRTISAHHLVMNGDDAYSEMITSQDRALTQFHLHDTVMYLPVAWQNCNCHGYVFTGGQFWIKSNMVQTILDDNGYQTVTRPRPHDVVVYRDLEGGVEHTGLVRGVSGDGIVLVESKWGKYGRFIHPADRTPYGETTCTYYRSPRPGGHLLRGTGSEHFLSSPPGELAPPTDSPTAPESDATVVGL